MGTSKGYIAPTTSHWSTAKRAVTAFINNRDFDSKAKAASKYATAMKTDMSTGGSFQSAAARTLGFAQKVASGGLDNALREYNREDLIGKPSEVVWTELLHEFTNSGASVEDNMAADALSQAMDNLEIEDIADIGNVCFNNLIITTATLLTNTTFVHKSGNVFISGYWHRIYNSFDCHQWCSGI